MTSRRRCSRTTLREAGTQAVTIPAPARRAACEDREGAPVSPSEPPTTSTDPAEYLLSRSPRRGTASRTPAVARRIRVGAWASPMSATTRCPTWNLPGATAWPTLGAWNVTVRAASTAGPATVPVDASTPDGRSTATIGTSAAFISTIARAASGRGAPENPVPNSASTTRSAGPGSSANATPSRFARARLTAASPVTFSSAPSSRTTQSRRARASSRATTSPSPPLAPVPHQTATRRASGKRPSASSATRRPARSMSSMVRPAYAASAARISSAV